MCELMTIGAAVAFTAIWAAGRRRGRNVAAEFAAMLMFWGAALMWSVDCVANRLDGEPLLDMSREDTILGVIIVAAGLLAYGAFAIYGRCRGARA